MPIAQTLITPPVYDKLSGERYAPKMKRLQQVEVQYRLQNDHGKLRLLQN
jgi:hypothetical protein